MTVMGRHGERVQRDYEDGDYVVFASKKSF
jgi:hypothetical protein